MYEFKLPDLGEGIHEAEIVKWYVQVGEDIGKDEPLVDVETDKATVTIPSPVGGTVVELAGEVGDEVHVGDVLAVVDTGEEGGHGGGTGEGAAKPDKGDGKKAPEKTAEKPKPVKLEAGGRKGPVPAAPATRRMARELGVDINRVPGSGPAGRVTPEDVKRFAEGGQTDSTEARPDARAREEREVLQATGIPLLEIESLPDFSRFGAVEVEQLRSIRRKTARQMTKAWIQIPHVSHFDEADVTDLEAFRRRNKQGVEDAVGAKLTPMVFVLKAAVRALKEFPQFNASLDAVREEIIYKRYYNIGVAVATDRGLMVPVVKAADTKSLAEVAADINDLAVRGRDGSLAAEDFQGSTFTITNMGPVGGTAATPIINHPEVAILAMMRATEKPVVREGRIEVRTMMPLVLSFDHRIIDGADAAAFVNRIVALLSDPEQLLLLS